MNSSCCAACKYLRRRCPSDCIFTPYFPSNNPQNFGSIHKIYGASNVGKLLQQLRAQLRAEAADYWYYEAQCRIEDTYGCVGIISRLYEQIHIAENQLAKTQAVIEVLSSYTQEYSQIQENGIDSSFINFLISAVGQSSPSTQVSFMFV